MFFFSRLCYSGTFVLPSPPPSPLPLPSGCLVTVILIENEQVIKQADDFNVVSNTHHEDKDSLVIITEAPYNRMFANEKPASQMVFSMPYRSLFD